MGNSKIKGLDVKPFIAGVEKGPKENSCTYLRPFIVASKPFNNVLEALFSALLLLTMLICPTLLLLTMLIFLTLLLLVPAISKPAKETNENTCNHNNR